ncbi:M1 family aminopeptidase [Polaribacter marinivivus]|uniref:M1 family aminopeptidase n=1 Tax=Polaribacter marinivivus TaxID=1524260 RepID=UPI003D32C6AE
MKLQHLVIIFFTLLCSSIFSQTPDNYKSEREKIFDLVHTKLKVDFNFFDKTMNGEAWVTLKPHYYDANKVVLDANTMIISEVKLNEKNLNFIYNDFDLEIVLPKTYTKNQEFTLYIKYLSQPEKVKDRGSKAITDAKGLYFINTDGFDKNKTAQIWTQGETQANSAWFPTIDAPNQKMTQEIEITVPNKYATLSNGALINQIKKGKNRTDHWKLDKKHAPYLAFIGVGEFEIIKDNYKNIPIDYYVEKEYAPYAKEIFGLTPEMIGFFETKLGVDFPWNKYSQIVVRDYVSGAMENTTAVVHGEQAYQKPGQLIDNNIQENTIAHEIFHHWFGNLVTSESWSNLALNESFANYSEYLWREYKYGKVNAEMHLFDQVEAYKNAQDAKNKSLVRFTYDDREDLFDLVSYNKGGAILHMLRKVVGDKAFFEGLKQYLTKYQYQSAEVHQLRLVFEELTGKDLNWFFNQWFYGAGHPDIQVSYDYNTLRKTVTVNLFQLQAGYFQFPISIDVFEGSKKTRHTVFVDAKDASFTFPYKSQPNLIQINSDNNLICDLNENKILSDYIFQLKHADNFVHRREALLEVVKKQEEKDAFNAVVEALNDQSYKIRILALENIDLINKFSKRDAINKIINIANNDKKTLVQASAIGTLGKLIDVELIPIFEKALETKSYSVLGRALVSMYYVDKEKALKKSKTLPDEVRKILATPLTRIFIEEKDDSELPFIAKSVVSGMFLSNDEPTKILFKSAFKQISESNNTEAIQNVVDDMVVKGKQYKGFNFDKVAINLMRNMVNDQKKADKPNREKNIAIIKAAMAKLL